MAAFIFWTTFFLITYHYFIFPIAIFILARVRSRPTKALDSTPSVTFIVAAYNEAKVIAEKIINMREMDYPADLIEFIVVADGSADETPELVRQAAFRDGRFQSLFERERRGKTAALNRAVAAAKNDILVFSDANSMFDADAIRKLVRHFHDPSVGGVCGRKSIVEQKSQMREAEKGDALFWDVESQVKLREGQIGSIPTADGEIFAMRRSLYREVDPAIINDDTAITFNILLQGGRVIYEPAAKTFELASINLRDDFKVKARMVYGGYQILARYAPDLGKLGGGFVLQFFSHKFLRHFMGILLLLIYFSNLALVADHAGSAYLIFLALQSAFYLMALVGTVLQRLKIPLSLFYLPMYYCLVNAAAVTGLFYFFRSKSLTTVWKKAAR